VLLAAPGCGGGGKSLLGAGSTLVAPLVAKWSSDYRQRAHVALTYDAAGSATGIAQVTARTIDFGASDAPLTSAQAASCGGCLQIPWALSATVIAYHLRGAPNRLRLSGPVLARIFLGAVKRWNDPAIARLNPGVKLPATPITPVFRSDGSGDTYALSDFLAKVSPAWRRREGVSTQISFPTGAGGRGSNGVAAYLGRNNGAVGYLALPYVGRNHLDYALVENAAGKFPVPGLAGISAAAGSLARIPSDNAISITNPPASAAGAYPIATFTYALVPGSSPKAAVLRAFLTYAVTTGQKFAFAKLPVKVVAADRSTIAKIG
jgi:phosphate transport system substrate-binding protein